MNVQRHSIVPVTAVSPVRRRTPDPASEEVGAHDDGPATIVSLSPEAQEVLDAEEPGSTANPNEMTAEQREVITQLQTRDAEVRSHEAAHQGAAGGLGGAASYSFQVGPDGRQYAVGGEVSIDMSPGSTPDETIARAQRIRAAALAPADPSSQDRAVAAAASQMAAAAKLEKAAMANEKLKVASEETESTQPAVVPTENRPQEDAAQASEPQAQEVQTKAMRGASSAFQRIAALG